MKRLNPWDKIFTKKGFLSPFESSLAKFPFYVDVEPTNDCNYDCLMCSRQVMKRPVGYMDMDVFKKIADEVANYDCGIRFCRFGEPLLHPKIFDMVKYANKKEIPTYISTNGLLLSKKGVIEQIFQSNLDLIRFSFQGVTKDGYELMRNTGGTKRYDIVCENIKKLARERDKTNSEKPFIILNTTTTNENEEDVDKFKNYWEKIVDKVEVGKTIFAWIEGECYEKLKHLISTESVVRVYKPCVEIMIKLSVNWNGDITPCCSDYDNFLVVGNVREMSLLNAWTSAKVNELRKMVSYNLRHEELELCRNCYKVEKKFDVHT